MGAGASSQTRPRYKWDSDHTLRGPWTFLFKEKVQCACEGSRWCTRENPARQKAGNALPGLHSSWVGDCVLAMARPWQAHVEQYRLVRAFQEANIGMILNLQEVGEHASCGPGNLPHCGFTYDPETFMAGGVGYYNFSWRDMGVPSLDRMMDIVQVMDYVTRVENRKIAVHCHAGLGRTGLAIACFFVFSGLYETPEAAIAAVRQNRAGAVQTTRQAAFVTIFAQYLQHLRCVIPPSKLPQSSSTTNMADASSGAGGDGGLATRSAPPASGSSPGSLPKDGLLESKATGNSVVGVYSSGLTVTVPLQADGAPGGGGGGGSDDDATLTQSDLGLTQPLPWNDSFHIQPQHAADFRPRPPSSYTEALARQARLFHGPERRAYLRLHKLVKEAVFAIIAAAHAFQPSSRNPTRSLLSLPAILENEPPPSPPLQQQRSKAGAAAMGAALAGGADGAGGGGGGGSSPHAPPLPPTFAHLLSYLLAHHGPSHVESEALAPLMLHKAYAAAVGPHVDSRAVLAAATRLREDVNQGQYGGVAAAPLLVVLMLLEAFFASFRSTPEDPSALTFSCLSAISKICPDLFHGQVPAPPSSRPTTAEPSANGPSAAAAGTANGTPFADSASARAAVSAANGSASATAAAAAIASSAEGTSLEYARQAYEILEPLEARDSELLLVFATLLRVVARGSGPGSEDAVVDVGKWATGLLLGRQGRLPEAEEAVLSFMWYLAGRDEAYAMLVLLKRQRMTGLAKRSRPGAGSADVAAMLQAAAASLAAAAAPPDPPSAPPPSPPCGAAGDAGAVSSTLVAMIRSSSDSGGSPLPSPAGSADTAAAATAADPRVVTRPETLSQLAQLLSQDIQQLYWVSYKDTLASVPTVLYPPPGTSGRIDVHDVWR